MPNFRRSAPAAVLFCVAAAALCAAHAAAEPLLLKAGRFDPAVSAQIESAPQDPYWLVQLRDSPGPAGKALIEQAGAVIVSYVPENGYLVRAEGGVPAALKALKEVAWVGPYAAAHRIDPAVPSDGRAVAITVLTFAGTDGKDILRAAGGKGVRVLRSSGGERGSTLVAETTGAMAHRMARLPGVRWIEPRVTPKLSNDVARGLIGVSAVWQNPGVFGSGQTVAVADTGLDVGADSPSLSPDFQGRVAAAFGLGRPGLTNDPHGHGTHVAGSVLGSGVRSGANPAAQSYSGSFAGIAPEANLVFQSILDSNGGLGGLPADLNDLLAQAYAAGARIHTNSWGADTSGSYPANSAEADEFIWNNPDMTVLFSAGNEALDANADGVIDQDSLNSPASAKNVIAVGASESLRSSGGYQIPWATGSWASDYPAEPISSDFVSDDPGGMAAFSSRGPCDDGRIKPDIAAPGTNIISCRSHVLDAGTLWGIYSNDYTYSGGTSMATPLAAGAAALVRQYHQQISGGSPSAALVKATMMVTAHDMVPGQYGTGAYQEMTARPNNVEGWGLLNVEAALSQAPQKSCHFVDEKIGVSTGQQKAYSITVTNTSVPVRVLLVWSDFPGDPAAAKALVNDLDLTVQGPDSSIRNGNGTLDRTNNVEGVDIANPLPGSYTIKVSAFKIPQGPQPFAIAVEGGLPSSGISGRVQSSFGSDVPGVTIAASNGPDTLTAESGWDGRFTLLAPAGVYTVTASKPDWTFSALPANVTVLSGETAVLSVSGTAPPAVVGGTAHFAARQTVSGPWESAHPYTSSSSTTVTVDGPGNAVRIRAHFARLEVESGFDEVTVRDGAGGTVATYSGDMENFWSPWVSGSSLQVNLRADVSVTGYGWLIDRCEIDVAGGPAAGVQIVEGRTGLALTTGPHGSFSFSGLEPLPTHLEASAAGYTVYPSRIDLYPAPRETALSNVFVAIPEVPVAHVDIAHTYVGDLTVRVGVGDPSNPVWSQVISARQGGSDDRLLLNMALDDGAQYFPPSSQYPWFVQACDEAKYDTGQIDAFSITKGGWTWAALDVPALIPDQGCAVLTVPAPGSVTVGEAKQLQDATSVLLRAGVVSAVFDDRFYVQDPLFSAGIALMGTAQAQPGDTVTAQGIMGTDGCERVVWNPTVAVNGPGQAPTPLNLVGRVLGGMPAGEYNPGFVDSDDLNNIGLLVGMSGWVTAVGTDFFYITDGSQKNDLSGNIGVRIAAEGLTIPPAGTLVTVFGISGCEDAGYGSARIIRPRWNADIIERHPAGRHPAGRHPAP